MPIFTEPIEIQDASGKTRIKLDTDGTIRLFDTGGRQTVLIDSQGANLFLGANGGSDGDIQLRNTSGTVTISLDGQGGDIQLT